MRRNVPDVVAKDHLFIYKNIIRTIIIRTIIIIIETRFTASLCYEHSTLIKVAIKFGDFFNTVL